MKALIGYKTNEHIICLREDGIIIEILKKFLDKFYEGQIINLPDNKKTNIN